MIMGINSLEKEEKKIMGLMIMEGASHTSSSLRPGVLHVFVYCSLK